MRVLEIGCGAGRMTRALAGIFGVNVSGEMIARGRQLLAGVPNVHLHRNSGVDLLVPKPILRLPARNPCISARVSRSRFCMVIVIHQQLVPFCPTHVQAHPVLDNSLR